MGNLSYIIDVTEHYRNGTLSAYLAALPTVMQDAAMRVLDRNADYIVALAQQIVRVDTGTLRRTIRKVKMGDMEIEITAGGSDINPKTGKPCNYAVIIESRYPFMRPAIDMVSPIIPNEIAMEIMSSIE